MALYNITPSYVVFKDKIPNKEYQEKLGIKKTNLFTRDTSKQIYSMNFLKETDPSKQFENYKYAREIQNTYNRVEKKQKRFSDEKSKDLYFEKNN